MVESNNIITTTTHGVILLQIPKDLNQLEIEMPFVSFSEMMLSIIMLFIMFNVLMPMERVDGCLLLWPKKAYFNG